MKCRIHSIFATSMSTSRLISVFFSTDVKERTLVQKKVAQFLLEMENLPLRQVHLVPISSVGDDQDVMAVKILHPQTKEDLSEKYEPKEPICPMPAEFYRRQIRECDERSKVRYVFCRMFQYLSVRIYILHIRDLLLFHIHSSK